MRGGVSGEDWHSHLKGKSSPRAGRLNLFIFFFNLGKQELLRWLGQHQTLDSARETFVGQKTIDGTSDIVGHLSVAHIINGSLKTEGQATLMVSYCRRMDSSFSAKKSLDLSNFRQKYRENIYTFRYMFLQSWYQLGLCRRFWWRGAGVLKL